MQDCGLITNLEFQPRFQLVVNGKKICDYIADFRYINTKGEEVIEDVKGHQTQLFKIKHALFEALYGRSVLLTDAKRILKKRGLR